MAEYGPGEAEVPGGVAANFLGPGVGSVGEAVLGIIGKHALKRLAACGVDASCMCGGGSRPMRTGIVIPGGTSLGWSR